MRVIPLYAGSLDIETLSTKPNAYILSISQAIYEIYTLKLVAKFDYLIGPNDQSQFGRLKEANTIDWWNGLAPNSPSEYAKSIVYNASGDLTTGIRQYDAFMRNFKAEYNLDIGHMITTCRGPDFDPVIMLNARQQFGLGYGQPFREIDSSRTIDRSLEIMNIKVSSDSVKEHCLGGEFHEHISLCDALLEGLEAATYYNRLAIAVGNPYIPTEEHLYNHWKQKEAAGSVRS